MKESVLQTAKPISKGGLWAGRIISGIIILFLLFDAGGKLIKESHHIDGTKKMGFSESMVQPIGIILLVITILYIIPRTAFAGVVLLTAYLGGAVAVMIILGTNIIFPIVFCVLAWTGFYFRNEKFRAFLS